MLLTFFTDCIWHFCMTYSIVVNRMYNRHNRNHICIWHVHINKDRQIDRKIECMVEDLDVGLLLRCSHAKYFHRSGF